MACHYMSLGLNNSIPCFLIETFGEIQSLQTENALASPSKCELKTMFAIPIVVVRGFE